jgi:hypothetical protein
VICTDCIGSCKSNYHTITATTAPLSIEQQLINQSINQSMIQLKHAYRKQNNIKPCTELYAVFPKYIAVILSFRDCMVVGLTTTYAISAYHYWCCELESRTGRGAQHYVKKFASDGRWFYPGSPVSSTNKTDCHDITEILLEVALSNIKQISVY